MSKLYTYNRYKILEEEIVGSDEWTYQFACNAPHQINTGIYYLNSLNYLIEKGCWTEIKNNGSYWTYLVLTNDYTKEVINVFLNPIRKTPTDYINLFYEIFINGLRNTDGTIQEKLTEIHKKHLNSPY